jgi:hypothetical protein
MRSASGKSLSVSSRMHSAKSTAARLSVTLTLRQDRWASRKMNRLAVPLRLYSQSKRSIALAVSRAAKRPLQALLMITAAL